MAARSARDIRLLDAVEALPAEVFSGSVYRVVRDGRDPLQCGSFGGRWDDRTFNVLYTSTAADGAIGEIHFHLRRGQPVMPSQVSYRLFEIRVTLTQCVRIAFLDVLASLGLNTSVFGQLSYVEREQEYPRTQEIAEAAYFHGRDGLIVPSARSKHPNLIVFCDPAGPGAMEVVSDLGLISWDEWQRQQRGQAT